jgi:hypothetical protein
MQIVTPHVTFWNVDKPCSVRCSQIIVCKLVVISMAREVVMNFSRV